MPVYLDLVILLNFLVDFLLLMGTNRLAGFPLGGGRCALAAILGSVYAGVCLLHSFRFLGNGFWRLVFLTLMAVIAFGADRSALRRGILFVLLSMALGGLAQGIGNGSFWAIVLGAAVLCLLCVLGFQGKLGREYVPVELIHGGKRCSVRALWDTGNTLTDPLTGQSVLVVGEEPALELLGLTLEQLSSPVETLASGKVPGLRLIPYRAVGQSSGMLLASRMEVKIGKKEKRCLVAFTPRAFGKETEYQGLIGGRI